MTCNTLEGKTVVLGITGGIAAYKAADMVSRLKKLGACVHVIMTRNAVRFITPLTLQTLSQNRVVVDMFEQPHYWEIDHISLAQKADLMVIAPASANIIGKIANGIADDMLSTTVMATKAHVIIAPAMNTNMYHNPFFQQNLNKLKESGFTVVEPGEGRLACGDCGKGRLQDINVIIDTILNFFKTRQDYKGTNALVTAGPTREPIDPVRFITNHSSGKMGYAIAEAFAQRGARVKLITGPTHLDPPQGAEVIRIQRAREMLDRVMEHFPWADVVVKAAAVSDYRPREEMVHKLKKHHQRLEIPLVKNPDILMELGRIKGDKKLIGFAAETDNVKEYARRKLLEKNIDMIVANNVTAKDAGFYSDTNKVSIIFANGKELDLPNMPKRKLAHIILDEIKTL
ncbi:MAG TPA: bifunctional phosphopantothenoylcysteine decarboxylase/phosphopantothenate--cysteine ligase CoaBC [Clostridiales bacterium]|nr:bifunctional phosphopantothenoylcysteine decarboxylase/phosphopantothenate--cysteine ligase CoaBC [Clostridiales bacterium]